MLPLKWKFLSAIAISSSLLISCGSTAHIEKDKSADLSKYKTYSWVPKDDKDASDIAEANLRQAVNGELEKNGWRQDNLNPDALLTYDVLIEKNVRNEKDPVYSQPYSRTYYNPYTRRISTLYFPSQFVGYDNYQVHVKEGTVTVSIIDSKTDKTVWQGWATRELDGSQIKSKEVEKNVKDIFKKFDAK